MFIVAVIALVIILMITSILIYWWGCPRHSATFMRPVRDNEYTNAGMLYTFTVGLGLGRQRIQRVARLERLLETERGM